MRISRYEHRGGRCDRGRQDHVGDGVARELGPSPCWRRIENPFIDAFYKNRRTAALACQLCFLEGRIAQFEKPRPDGLPVVADHTLAKDKLFAALNLADDEWELYMKYYRRLAPAVEFKPEVTIYCKADLDEVGRRIKDRGRTFEDYLDRTYLQALIQSYDDRFAKVDDHPVIVVSTNTHNIAKDREAVQRLHRDLSHGAQGPELLQSGPADRPASRQSGNSSSNHRRVCSRARWRSRSICSRSV